MITDRFLTTTQNLLYIDVIPHGNARADKKKTYYEASQSVIFGEYIIKNTQDMVGQIKKLVKKRNAKIIDLTITGHGNETGFLIGSDAITMKKLNSKDSNDQKIANHLAELRFLFASKAIVTLRACQTGKNSSLLKKLSVLWGGISVRGSHDNQFGYFPWLQGKITMCQLKTCETKK